MEIGTRESDFAHITQEGQVTIPRRLCEKYGIDTPGEVLLYEENERIVVEPLPSAEDLYGIHAGDHEPGDILAKVQEQKREEKRDEAERSDYLNP